MPAADFNLNSQLVLEKPVMGESFLRLLMLVLELSLKLNRLEKQTMLLCQSAIMSPMVKAVQASVSIL